jgi:nucleoside-diphosphate-sugar epimerase
MKVAITGAGSVLARSIMPLLDADERIESILALDNCPYTGFPSPKIKYRNVDVRNARELESAMAGAGVVLHLAFIVAPRVLDRRLINDVNIEGSKNAARAAASAGAAKFIYTSSVAAYGMVPGNPPVVTEETPLRGEENANNFFYPYTKAAVEKFLDEFEPAHPSLTITRFRPHLLTGPIFWRHSGNLFVLPDISRSSGTLWGFKPKSPTGLLFQYTHEADLAKAIYYAVHHLFPGAYNIAGEPFDLGEHLAGQGRKFRTIPWPAVNRLAGILGPFSGRVRVARQWLVGARYRNIMDCSKLKRAGYDAPLRTTLDCIREVNALARTEPRSGKSKPATRPGAGQP